MIYEVLLDGKTLYYPGDLQCAVTNAKLERALNDAGTFDCDVPATNPLYNAIENRRSMVQILKDGREIFYGEVRESEESLDMVKQIYAVGELAFLYDSIQPQGRYQDQTPLQFFTTLINNHNAQVEEKKRFYVGVVTVKDPNDSIYRYTNYEDTLTCMRDKLCDRLGGYLRVRKVDGKRYLDLVTLQDYGTTCEQPIEFGENLLDYACNASSTDVVTAVIPLGTRLDKSPIEGLDAYLDIKDVNNGVDYVYLPAAVEKFGWIKKVVHWDDVTTPANLKKKAEEWLTENQYELLTLEVNALDLSMMNSDIDSFDLGDSVNALAEPYGMDAWFPVQKVVTYLQNPEKNQLTLSNTLKKSYTQQMASLTNELDEKIPQQSALLQQAKDNASQLIQTATNGYIVLNMDDKGNPKELLIMDTKDIDTAQKVWRWNINGLGYSHTGYNGEYGLALTMDGSIVADFVTAGTMYADRIKGGTLTLGGKDNVSGVAQIQDENGNVLILLDKAGITLADSVKIAWSSISGTDDIVNEDRAVEITKDTVTAEYVNALKIIAGSVDAENITGTTITGKHIKSGYMDGTNIFFAPSGTEVQPDDPMSAGQGGIVYVQAGKWDQLDVYGSDELVLSTSRSVDDGGVVTADRKFNAKRGVTVGADDTEGYGWVDWYCYGKESGSIYAHEEYGLVIEGRDGKPVTIKSDKSMIQILGTTCMNTAEVDGLRVGCNNPEGYGWVDVCYGTTLSGSIFPIDDAIVFQSKNGNDISLNASTDGSGTIRYYGSLVQNSSERYKENMVNITEEYADKILDLVPMEFDYKATGKHCLGLKAEQVIDVIPQIVNLDNQGRPDGVSYIEIIPLLLKKIQMLDCEIKKSKGE